MYDRRGILGNRGFGFDTGWLPTNFLFFFNLIENNLLMVKKFQCREISEAAGHFEFYCIK